MKFYRYMSCIVARDFEPVARGEMNADTKENQDIDEYAIISLLSLTHATMMSLVSQQGNKEDFLCENWSPPEPYQAEEEYEEPYLAEVVKNEEEEENDKKRKHEEEAVRCNKRRRLIVQKRKKVNALDFFTNDVCRVGTKGRRPGKFVFLTKTRTFKQETNAIEWVVEAVDKGKFRRRDYNVVDVTTEVIWSERECDLIKEFA